MIVPNYYELFKCRGSECRSNCCRGGWDIEIDDEALLRFSHIKGEFGERVRAAVSDDNTFIHSGGSCPLLSESGLCEMVLHGEELCTVCDEYPRFTEFYDDYTERGISVSCEAAADLILGNTAPVKLTGDREGCTEPIFMMISTARDKVFEILQRRDTDILKRLRLAMDYTRAVQDRINENLYSDPVLYTPTDAMAEPLGIAEYLSFLRGLEMLTPKWDGMLSQAHEREMSGMPHRIDQIKCEQLAVYFVYRYFLKGAFDCDVLTKMKFAALSVMAIVALENTFGDMSGCAALYSIEIEHDEDNVEAIYDELIFSDKFSYSSVLAMIN